MLSEYSFSSARSNLTELIDRVQRMVPAVIKPRKKSEEASVVLSRSLLMALLPSRIEDLAAKLEFIMEPDGSVTATLDPMDIAVNAETKEAATRRAAEEAIEYAREYLSPKNAAVYMRSPNRSSHLPIVVRISLCDSVDEVLELLTSA